MAYDILNISNNSTGILSFTQGVNDILMGGWLGVLILLTLTVIIFMAFQFSTNDVRKSLLGACFLAFGLSIFLRAVNLIPDLAMYIALILSAIMIAFSIKE